MIAKKNILDALNLALVHLGGELTVYRDKLGELISVSPLRVRIGDVDYEAEDIRLCTHVTLPQAPGGNLVLVSFDEGQTFVALGRC